MPSERDGTFVSLEGLDANSTPEELHGSRFTERSLEAMWRVVVKLHGLAGRAFLSEDLEVTLSVLSEMTGDLLLHLRETGRLSAQTTETAQLILEKAFAGEASTDTAMATVLLLEKILDPGTLSAATATQALALLGKSVSGSLDSATSTTAKSLIGYIAGANLPNSTSETVSVVLELLMSSNLDAATGVQASALLEVSFSPTLTAETQAQASALAERVVSGDISLASAMACDAVLGWLASGSLPGATATAANAFVHMVMRASDSDATALSGSSLIGWIASGSLDAATTTAASAILEAFVAGTVDNATLTQASALIGVLATGNVEATTATQASTLIGYVAKGSLPASTLTSVTAFLEQMLGGSLSAASVATGRALIGVLASSTDTNATTETISVLLQNMTAGTLTASTGSQAAAYAERDLSGAVPNDTATTASVLIGWLVSGALDSSTAVQVALLVEHMLGATLTSTSDVPSAQLFVGTPLSSSLPAVVSALSGSAHARRALVVHMASGGTLSGDLALRLFVKSSLSVSSSVSADAILGNVTSANLSDASALATSVIIGVLASGALDAATESQALVILNKIYTGEMSSASALACAAILRQFLSPTITASTATQASAILGLIYGGAVDSTTATQAALLIGALASGSASSATTTTASALIGNILGATTSISTSTGGTVYETPAEHMWPWTSDLESWATSTEIVSQNGDTEAYTGWDQFGFGGASNDTGSIRAYVKAFTSADLTTTRDQRHFFDFSTWATLLDLPSDAYVEKVSVDIQRFVDSSNTTNVSASENEVRLRDTAAGAWITLLDLPDVGGSDENWTQFSDTVPVERFLTDLGDLRVQVRTAASSGIGQSDQYMDVYFDELDFTVHWARTEHLYTDFSRYPTGSAPEGWTGRFGSSLSNWQVASDSGATGGQVLHRQAPLSESVTIFSYDVLDNEADVELTIRAKQESVSSVATSVWVRASGSDGAEEGYRAFFDASSTEQLVVSRFVNGTETVLGSSAFDIVADPTYMTLKFRVKANTLKAKAWHDESESEPTAWDIEVTDDIITTGGWVGVGDQSNDDIWYDTFDAKVIKPKTTGIRLVTGSGTGMSGSVTVSP